MTKKHYNLLAKEYKLALELCPGDPVARVVARHMIWVTMLCLKADNPRFNPDTFLEACGYYDGGVL